MSKAGELSGPLPCFRCGECCRRFQVLLNPDDVRRLADYLGISITEFSGRYADPRWPDENKVLVRHTEEGCPFLQGRGREFRCAVHPVKPVACRDWAASYTQPECRRGLERFWGITPGTEGKWQGSPEALQEFRSLLEYYRGA
jgi:Fe-S-cluster containining protein